MRAPIALVALAVAACGGRAAPPPQPRSAPAPPPIVVPPVSAAPQPVPVPLPAMPSVHVALTRVAAAGRARVQTKGDWTVVDAAGATVRSGRSLDGDLDLAGAVVSLAGLAFPPGGELKPASDGDLRIDVAAAGRTESRVYPGHLRVERGRDAKWQALIVTDAETYVAGVVSGEIPASFPREAQRAQAVIARTYALRSTVRTSPDAPLLVTDVGAIDQEFPGLPPVAEHRRVARDAAESTRGIVLVEDGSPFVAYYHSTCGGTTCPGPAVFEKTRDVVALAGGVACPWCAGTKYFRWNATIDGAAVVRAAGLAGTLESFAVAETTAGGRATAFDVRAGGRSKRVRAPEFRLAVGPSVLRSVLLDEAAARDGSLVVAGRGWGHGVGLCQMGAKALAEAGRSAETILRTYYPGAATEPRW